MKRLPLLLLALSFMVATMLAAAPRKRPAKQPAVTWEEISAAIDAYDFDHAAELLDRFSIPDGDPDGIAARVEEARQASILGSNMLERVEQTAILDSVEVDADDFFSHMRLGHDAGSLEPASLIPMQARAGLEVADPIYVSADSLTMLWTGFNDADIDSTIGIYQSVKLADGSFSSPERVVDLASMFPDSEGATTVAWPFLMADGATLYFAADGGASLGGLDIFMTRRDDQSGQFLQPSNMGMPYNSPANDYMLCVDESAGVGWWATDRHAAPGKVKIFTFAPAESRVNYPVDTEQLTALASLSVLPPRPADADARLNALQQLASESRQPQFSLPLPDGRVLTSTSQLTGRFSAELLPEWLEASRIVDNLSARIGVLRRKYAAGQKNVAHEILDIERNQLPQARQKVKQLLNEIIKEEISR